MPSDIERMFEHMEWANQRLLRVMLDTPHAMPPAALRLFGHLLAAERVWLLRLRGEDSGGQAVWPEHEANELVKLAAGNRAGYQRLLSGLDGNGPMRIVEYRNQQGKPYQTTVRDILIHVAMHGSYHRGQIATRMRDADNEPVNTDFITFARESGSHPG